MRSAIKLCVVVLFITGVQVFQSCRHEPTLPDKQVSFTTDILPVIGASCQEAGCHGANGGEFALLNYDDMMLDSRIVANQPYQSKIYKAIVSQKKDKVMPVPPRKPLTETQIETIFIWIKQGAQNN